MNNGIYLVMTGNVRMLDVNTGDWVLPVLDSWDVPDNPSQDIQGGHLVIQGDLQEVQEAQEVHHNRPGTSGLCLAGES